MIMQRGKPAQSLSITPRQKRLLARHRNKASISVQCRTRIDIVLGAINGQSNTEICEQLAICRSTVVSWRSRWASSYQQLCAFEAGLADQGVPDRQLLDQMLDILRDLPRSGAPERIPLSEKQQLIALACEKPEDYGIPFTQWNREMLAKVAMAEGIVEKISPRYVGKLLKKAI